MWFKDLKVMKIQYFIQLVLLLSAGSAWAMPVVNLNQVLSDDQPVKCQRNSQETDFRNLVHRASFMDQDDREVLSKNLVAIGFSAAEQEQAMRCTGHIHCPGGKDGRGTIQSAGSLCPLGKRTSGGHCAADRIASVGHIFVDKETNRFIPQKERCEFRNYRGHTSKLEIKDVDVLDPSNPANNPYQNMRADKLVIRLKRPIPGCDPYDLPDSSEPPSAGTKVVALTYIQEDQAGKFDGSEPMAYNCNVTRTFSARGGGPSLSYTNCDVNGGGSGGFALTRNSNNRLAVSGMFIRIGALELNGKPYDEANKNYTIAVGTNADFIQIAENPGQRPDPQLSQGVSSPLRPASGR
jgi:hypothetical protein